ncbi:hypothetical protein A3C98_01860 [Candidatus Roizmanbacteria bacterium RIFCSPHIGHO2_02_FULL_37_15]|uniref:EfeO-type cupredoxin-like domain-containing protein n=1 Tax=Candidatus Roizmanbacteria bacterium RIFCSPLOWO2_01_FULL_37_16 TaxID=1802058 RepID=A0A1F7IPL4_9BACT|nr:MAG: hypothetical protein A2859_01925 [Candidatus Roizmanbacteria bacterium RIFCSPHIGHO2_01_FULL_37_16b]OGK22146.1 MAG: hypothetical protein A3C98_01860 [Candidatus Roizmanbacteria bacterium RIFCSPHIGHO2_02_FULL_37_15]OGK34110.1 MAG: hypothetical protein A3F57_06725 [Candidatus Roizmanbacteria bacterium RIFCSPHIGHO2_12_FULL_36_11]OGK45317.1 MAG: hypothetical protein A3B40_05485 [Candidatus Roizmanbacteria bacterium RIFCSPLOWO2_01_FULL_37_16]OGK57126.1 MAG: hypothetical protein A3I50_02055 [C
MNKTLLIVIIAGLLLAGVFVLSKNQSTVGPSTQTEQTTDQDNGDDVEEKDEVMEKEDKAEEKEDEAMEEAEDESERTVVSVTDTGFEPQTVTVKVGTKVVWRNKTNATVNVSSAKHPTHLEYPPLNLANFEPGETISLVFTEAGTYKYHDHLNPSKFGTVVVE